MPPEKQNPPNRGRGDGGLIKKQTIGLSFNVAPDGLVVNLIHTLTRWQQVQLASDRRAA